MTAAAAADAPPEPISPNVNRVVQSLSLQLAEALAEATMLRDVVQQYVARDAAAGTTRPAVAASDPATDPSGDAPPA